MTGGGRTVFDDPFDGGGGGGGGGGGEPGVDFTSSKNRKILLRT